MVMVSHRAYLGLDSEVTHGVPRVCLRHPFLGLGEFWQSLTPCSFSVHLGNQFLQVSGPEARRQAPHEARKYSPHRLISVSPIVNVAGPELHTHGELPLPISYVCSWVGTLGNGRRLHSHGWMWERRVRTHSPPSAPPPSQGDLEVREFWEKCKGHLEM